MSRGDSLKMAHHVAAAMREQNAREMDLARASGGTIVVRPPVGHMPVTDLVEGDVVAFEGKWRTIKSVELNPGEGYAVAFYWKGGGPGQMFTDSYTLRLKAEQ